MRNHIPAMSVRTNDPVTLAEQAVARYSEKLEQAHSKCASLLNAALGASYAAALALRDDPEKLAEFLGDQIRRPGPNSTNPFQPILRKLWQRSPSREAVYRYAACLAWAEHKGIGSAQFVEWIEKLEGGIKTAARQWSHCNRRSGAGRDAREARANRVSEIIAKSTFGPIPCNLPCETEGLYLVAVQVTPERNAEIVLILDGLKRSKVDKLILSAFKVASRPIANSTKTASLPRDGAQTGDLEGR